MLAYFDGNQLIDQNPLHENLLNNSIGPFPPDVKAGLNYQIFDKSTVNLIEGVTYCLSFKGTGNLWAKPFDDTADDTCFMFYIYLQNHSQYQAIYGTKKGKSVSFTSSFSGSCVLCVQYKALVKTDLNKFPKVEQVKLEMGDKATAWIPSSQDLADMISKMVGVKLRYRLYYATSSKEVA